jgi:hypothetical protein
MMRAITTKAVPIAEIIKRGMGSHDSTLKNGRSFSKPLPGWADEER